MLQFIVDASAALTASLDYATTLRTIARFALPALGDWCAVDLLDAQGRIQRAAVACADPGDEALLKHLKHDFPLPAGAEHPVAEVIRTGSAALVRDMRLLERGASGSPGADPARPLAPTALLSIPLAIGQAIVGSLTFAFARPGREYGIAELELANAYAKPAARALEHARRFQGERLGRQRAERAIDYASRLQRVAAGLTSALTAGQVAEVILHEGLAALEAQAGSVCLLTDNGSELEVLQSQGYDEAVIARWQRFPVSGRSLLADVVRGKKAEFLSSRAQRSRRYPAVAAEYDRLPYHSWAALPLIVDGRVIGGIGLSFVEARSWSVADRRFMETLGHQCAQALERARLYESEARAMQRAFLYQDQLIVLATASVMLNTSLEFEPTLSNVCQFMVAHLADWAAVLLLDPASPARPRLLLAQSAPLDEPRAALLQQIIDGRVAGMPRLQQVLSNGATILAAPNREPLDGPQAGGPAWGQLADALGAGSLIATPLVSHDRTLGALLLGRAPGREPFASAALGLVEEVAHRAALAIDHASHYQDSQNAIRIRDNFFGLAAHELKTPITSLIGYTQLLQRRLGGHDQLQERDRRGLQTIMRQAQRLNDLSQSLLDAARIHDGRLVLNRQPVDICKLATHISDELNELEGGARIRLECDADDLSLDGDDLRLEQMLRHLLQNALKHSPRSSPVLLRLANAAGHIEITVRDEGIGIPADEQEHIFERFYRGSNAEEAAVGGLGIGLYVVHEVVNRHFGQISVESQPDQGATFTVRLPLVAAAEAAFGPN